MLENSCSFTGRLIPKSSGYHIEVSPNKHMKRTAVPLALSERHAETVEALFAATYAATVTGFMQSDPEGALYLYVTDIDLHGLSENTAALLREQ